MDKIEQWRIIIIDNIQFDYAISSKGRVYSLYSKKILKQYITNAGYARVTLYNNTKSYHKSIHRLVALMYIDNYDELPEVNHKDGNKLNNDVDNLEWVSKSYNEIHAYNHNLKHKKYGDESHLSKYKKKDVRYSCELMESGEYTLPEISEKTGIDIAMIYMIKNRKSWVNISKFYDIDNYKEVKNTYTDSQIEKVFILLEQNKLSIYDISDITNVKTSTIYNIIIHRYSKFKYFYDLYDISKYDSRKKMEDFSDESINEIIDMYNKNIKIDEICKYINNKYKYNIDRIRHYINRNKKKFLLNDYRKHE